MIIFGFSITWPKKQDTFEKDIEKMYSFLNQMRFIPCCGIHYISHPSPGKLVGSRYSILDCKDLRGKIMSFEYYSN